MVDEAMAKRFSKAEMRRMQLEYGTAGWWPESRQKTIDELTAMLAPKERPPRQFVRMFKPQFARLVESGAKQQTVRPMPMRMPQPGDVVSLREWTGKPYRSKQRELRRTWITAVQRIAITPHGMSLDGMAVASEEGRERFAQADGFSGWKEMLAWFEAEHGVPFDGIVIYW
jgi:hypothetical protein